MFFDNPLDDPNGNLTADGTNTYTYDSENRLRSVVSGPSSVVYTYDPLGRRLSKTVNGATIRFLYDGDQLIAETNATGTITAKYVFGPGLDEPLKMVRGSTTSYFHVDGLGSVVGLTDTTGTVVEKYRYDVYGQVQITTASDTVLPQSAVGNRFLFTGRELDTETGLYYYRARYYDAKLGRFLSRDPVGYTAGLNLYAYVDNNPLSFVDPLGLEKRWNLLGQWARNLTLALSLAGVFQGLRTSWTFLGNLLIPLAYAGQRDRTVHDVGVAGGGGGGFGWGQGGTGGGGGGVPRERALVPYYPPNRGFTGQPTNTTLQPGTVIDRYGGRGGSFASPQGTPPAARSLPPGAENRPLNAYEVVQPVQVDAGQAASWYGQPGGGIQYDFGRSIQELIDAGVLRPDE